MSTQAEVLPKDRPELVERALLVDVASELRSVLLNLDKQPVN
jgi:hypothetical protein